jgi:hypothetical protein
MPERSKLPALRAQEGWDLLYIALDIILLILATARCTRLITTDNVPGNWWIYGPLYKKAAVTHPTPKWSRYLEGLTCPFCVGFWIGCVAIASLILVGGPGEAAVWWRWLAGAFALNYVVGHVSSRLD